LLSKFYAIKPAPIFHPPFGIEEFLVLLIYSSDSIFWEDPGGFFQWEEIETRDLSCNPPSEITTKVREIMRASPIASGLTNSLSTEIEQAFKKLGLVDIIVEDYNSVNRLDLINHVREWTKAGAKAALYHSSLRCQIVKDKEEARSASAGLWKAYAAEIDGGVVPCFLLTMMLGRKVSVSSAS
jgi:hypothetical protein